MEAVPSSLGPHHLDDRSTHSSEPHRTEHCALHWLLRAWPTMLHSHYSKMKLLLHFWWLFGAFSLKRARVQLCIVSDQKILKIQMQKHLQDVLIKVGHAFLLLSRFCFIQ